MKLFRFIFITGIVASGVIVIILTGAYIYFTYFYTKPVYISDHKSLIKAVNIQPSAALRIAMPYMKKNATYIYKDKKKAKIHIVYYEGKYFIKKTDYPAKSANFYLHHAVMVDVRTGMVSLSKKNQ